MAPGAILVTSSIINLRTLTTRGGAGQYAMRDCNPGRDAMHATLVEMPLYFEVSAGWRGRPDSGWDHAGVLADVAAGRLTGVNVRSTRMPDGTWVEEPLPEAGSKGGRAAALAVAAAAAKKIASAGRGAGSATPSAAAAGPAGRSGEVTGTPTGAASPSRASEVSDADAAAVLPQATGGHPILGSWGGLPKEFAPVASAVAPAAVCNGCGGLGTAGAGAAAGAEAPDGSIRAGAGADAVAAASSAGRAGKSQAATPATAARVGAGAGAGASFGRGPAAASPASRAATAAPPLSARSSGGGAFGPSSSAFAGAVAAESQTYSAAAAPPPRYVLPQYLLYCSEFDNEADAVWERGGGTAAGEAVRQMIALRRIIVERDSKDWPGAGK